MPLTLTYIHRGSLGRMIARKGSRAQKSLGGNGLVWGCPRVSIFPYKVGPFFRPKTPLHADLEIFRSRPRTDPSATHPTLFGRCSGSFRPQIRAIHGHTASLGACIRRDGQGASGYILMDTRIYWCITCIYIYIYISIPTLHTSPDLPPQALLSSWWSHVHVSVQAPRANIGWNQVG